MKPLTGVSQTPSSTQARGVPSGACTRCERPPAALHRARWSRWSRCFQGLMLPLIKKSPPDFGPIFERLRAQRLMALKHASRRLALQFLMRPKAWAFLLHRDAVALPHGALAQFHAEPEEGVLGARCGGVDDA